MYLSVNFYEYNPSEIKILDQEAYNQSIKNKVQPTSGLPFMLPRFRKLHVRLFTFNHFVVFVGLLFVFPGSVSYNLGY